MTANDGRRLLEQTNFANKINDVAMTPFWLTGFFAVVKGRKSINTRLPRLICRGSKMSRRPWGIKPSEIKRAINGVLQSGHIIKEIKFEKDGHFSVIPGKSETPAGIDDLDRELEEFEAGHEAGR
jgi:hypothetical protein